MEGIFRKRIHNLLTKHHRTVVKDEALAEKLLPKFDIGCKRITPSNEYLPCYNKDNVTLVTEGIKRFTAEGIETNDGNTHKVDSIIYATGFSIIDSARAYESYGIENPKIKYDTQSLENGYIVGKDTKFGTHGENGRISLSEEWDDQPNAYKGIAYPDYPNMFFLLGPGTGLGHNSAIYMIECQINYTVHAIRTMIRSQIKSINLKRHVNDEYQAWVQECMKNKVFALSTCKSWYKNKRGINYTLWPSHLIHYWWVTRKVSLDDYICRF